MEKKAGLDPDIIGVYAGPTRPIFPSGSRCMTACRRAKCRRKKSPPESSRIEGLCRRTDSQLTAFEQEATSARWPGALTMRRLEPVRIRERPARSLSFGADASGRRDLLPEDGEAYRFNKSGAALDVSHVQMARYLSESGRLRDAGEALSAEFERPPTVEVRRYYACGDQSTITRHSSAELSGLPFPNGERPR